MNFTLGLDFGTNSVRAVVVDVSDGREIGTGVSGYASGVQGILLDGKDPHLARQSPRDHLDGLKDAVHGAIRQAEGHPGFKAELIGGIGVAATGSSPLPVDGRNVPLAFHDEWKDDLNAQCWLWKDHTARVEAEEITRVALEMRPEYVRACGGVYLSEWFWAKVWHCLRVSPEIFHAAFTWIELADWIPSVLAGVNDPLQIQRGVCSAGHKALYSDHWGGLPDSEFLRTLDPALEGLREKLYQKAYDATHPAGSLCGEWAKVLGLREGISIAIGKSDVHYGAIGCGVKPGRLVKVIGTSSCDCCVLPAGGGFPDIPGISGVVEGAILPGFYGLEAGQSAVGDIFKWWIEKVCGGDDELYRRISEEAGALKPGESGLLALDWNNGNRNVLADPMLGGLLVGQTLHTTRGEIYRALMEATAFGSRMIVNRLREHGVVVNELVCAGGIAEKNTVAMEILTNVLGVEIHVTETRQACALGAAIAAASVAGLHEDVAAARDAMASGCVQVYRPDPERVRMYDRLSRSTAPCMMRSQARGVRWMFPA
jgi:L-ribulokinase